MINVIGKKYIFLTFSSVLTIIALATLLAFGFRTGVDFAGGVSWQLHFDNAPTVEQLAPVFTGDAVITPQSNGNFLIRLKDITDTERKAYSDKLAKSFGKFDELQFQNIGPVVGQDLKQKAIYAFVFVLLAISLYVAFAFRRVSRPVSSWKYGIITLLTLFHDAIIPAGMFAILGKLFNAEIDTNFVVAILMVMGFSVHDTIVVFDRIRENLRLARLDKTDFSSLVNDSVNQTMARSINTSFTLILTLVALLVFGPITLHYFILTILVGVLVGTYSSIFVASPLLSLWQGKK